MSLSPAQMQERRAALFWGVFIVALFGINVAVAGIAVFMAVGDPSFRPMPSYGENAIDWETRKLIQAASDGLGWTAEVERNQDFSGVRVRILDREGQPVKGCAGEFVAYHFTRADRVYRLPLSESESEPGSYFVPFDASQNGSWQITLDAKRQANERFFSDRVCEWYP